MKRVPDSLPPLIALDAGGPPIYRQLSDGLRRAIVDGQLQPGQRMPSTRALAAELKVSRLPVLSAYEQLQAECYLQAFHGSGTRVAAAIPGQIRVRLDGSLLGTIQIPSTGGLQNWQTVTLTNLMVNGGPGAHALRLEMVTGGEALNWIEFDRIQICGTNNLALGLPATASSVQSSATPQAAALDGDPTTRWSSVASDPQWFQVDLGAVQPLGRVRLNWEDAYAQSYSIQFSTDSNSWSTVCVVTNGAGTINDLATPGIGRFVRVNGTQRGSAYGYSLWELEVYAATAPELALAVSGTHTVVSWPASWFAWTLESASTLGVPGDWTSVSAVPQLINSEFALTNEIATLVRFYRLKLN